MTRIKKPPNVDPIEKIIEDALKEAGIDYTTGEDNDHCLDFDVPELNCAIEVKQFHSDRIAKQMSRTPNVIAVQGRASAESMAQMIKAYGKYKNSIDG